MWAAERIGDRRCCAGTNSSTRLSVAGKSAHRARTERRPLSGTWQIKCVQLSCYIPKYAVPFSTRVRTRPETARSGAVAHAVGCGEVWTKQPLPRPPRPRLRPAARYRSQTQPRVRDSQGPDTGHRTPPADARARIARVHFRALEASTEQLSILTIQPALRSAPLCRASSTTSGTHGLCWHPRCFPSPDRRGTRE